MGTYQSNYTGAEIDDGILKARKHETEKANVNGTYDDMTVGMAKNAEQLKSTVYVKDTEPYSHRTAGGSADIGNRAELKKIVGATVAWNQLCNLDITNYLTYYEKINNSLIRAKVDIAGSSAYPRLGVNWITGHKYLICRLGTSETYCSIYWETTNYTQHAFGKNAKFIMEAQSNWSSGAFFINTSGTILQGTTIGANIIDLTQMFGTTIADYIYSLETANAGSGVAFFKKLFPKDYYAYNAGELLSVNTSGRKTVGFNQLKTAPLYWAAEEARVLNKETFSKLLAGKEYQFNFDSIGTATSWKLAISAYDLNENLITDTSLFTSDITLSTNDYFIKTGSISAKSWTFTPAVDMYINIDFWDGDTTSSMSMVNACMHLTWSGYRNGQYEDYKENSYALDSSLTLRGILKLDANNKLYADGDIYRSDGSVERRYGYVAFADLTWSYIDSADYPYFRASPDNCKACNNGNIGNIKFAKYPTSSVNEGYAGHQDKIITVDQNSRIRLYDSSYTDLTTFTQAMNGQFLLYELAESTTEEAEAYTELQIVDDFGTEEFVDYAESQGTRDVSIPVGHETFYLANLRDKLQRLPDSTNSNGDYIIRQTGTQMSLIPNPTKKIYQHLVSIMLGTTLTAKVSIINNSADDILSANDLLSAIGEHDYPATGQVMDNTQGLTLIGLVISIANSGGLVAYWGAFDGTIGSPISISSATVTDSVIELQ